jgi:hypothetical protein
MAAVIGMSCLQLVACGQSTPVTGSVGKPATVEHLDGKDPTRVTLTADAEKRLDLRIDTARDVTVEGIQRLVIPYSAIVYDTKGKTWTYTNPEPLTFLRHAITVDHIDGDNAILSEGLVSGTSVVAVGAEELFGAESEFEEE